jgi:nondiscriminating aspartyl-tRNA synthetase
MSDSKSPTPTEEKKEQGKPEEKKKVDPKKAAKLLRQQEEEEKRLAAHKNIMKSITFEEAKNETQLFGNLPRIQSTFLNTTNFSQIGDLNKDVAGKEITVRARVFTVRSKGKGSFILLRQGITSIQACFFKTQTTPENMEKFIANLSKESIVDVTGKIVVAEVDAATQKDVEIQITKIYGIVTAYPLPIQVEDAMVPEEEEEKKEEKKEVKPEDEKKKGTVGQELRLDNRVIDMRAPANLAIFKIQSHIGHYFREFLHRLEFYEIHTPKLIATASEGGADVFSVKYFGTTAYLAQSPQLYKQMAVQGDLMRVYEIGPVFRAEKSLTHRHMTEFVGCDLEMTINSHYNEVLEVLDDLFKYIFDSIQTKHKRELEVISQQYPFTPLVFDPKKNLRLTYLQATKLLQEDGEEIGDYDDMGTRQEKRLGRIVKEKYGTDFYMVDKFPLALRPFYTMPCPDDKLLSNSYDLFIRGEEIASGAQRIHESELLLERAKELKVDLNPIKPYVDCFRYGAYPHGGAGIGLERVVMLFLGLHNIRKTSMFPRDPKRLTP